MQYPHFSRNGVVLDTGQAVVPLADLEYEYGFGVYETIRVTKRIPYFLAEHTDRLIESARIIGLEHDFSTAFVEDSVRKLIENTEAETYNLKLLLIGGPTKAGATLYILCLNPLFPDRKFYRDGVSCSTYRYERTFPHAKSLNMLESYMAYRQAVAAGAYDALLINHDDCVTEGTRTNFFCLRGKRIISPPEAEILLGVMRRVTLKVAADSGFEIRQQAVKLDSVASYDSAFLTSTSSRIIPVTSVGGQQLALPNDDALRELMAKTDRFLADCGGTL